MITVKAVAFDDWRTTARSLLAAEVPPDEIFWASSNNEQSTLFQADAPVSSKKAAPRVPREFVKIATEVAYHRDEAKWALLYRVLFRITHGEPHLLNIDTDSDVMTLRSMERAVSQDIYRMHQFVRFRRVQDPEGERFVAWHKPDHPVVAPAAEFFVKRFASMRWSILTPDGSAHWDKQQLALGPGVRRSEAPSEDQLEELWNAYYAAVFNPARLNVDKLKKEVPLRHWPTLPEAGQIHELIRQAPQQVELMVEAKPASAAPFIPPVRELPALRSAVQQCEGCELYRCATQAVFGEGPANARVVLVGEQPGDEEDLKGRPFVGPAGRLLDRALAEAGVNRSELYVTNAVKHFGFIERGKRRIHSTPRAMHISACRPWLEAEMAALEPELIVCLGATAAQSVMGRVVRIMQERGRLYDHHWARRAMITLHPSALLRIPEEQRAAEQYALFVNDFRQVRDALKLAS